MSKVSAADYADILLSDRPLIDLRAPIEFNKGAFEQSVNLPLMTDSERAAVGTCYKKSGQMAAIELGHKLVQGKVKAQRQQAWAEFIAAHPDTYLYCFRGGLRSQISQQWLKEIGINLPFIEGGYKGMRGFLMQQTEQIAAALSMWIVGGMTGCGKTDFLKLRQDQIDLEGLANHRGSSFGRQINEQPAQISFENTLAVQLMRHQRQGHQHLVLEDESRLIGRISIPLEMHNLMQQSPLVLLEVTQEDRISRIVRDYVIDIEVAFVARDGEEEGRRNFETHLLSALDRIHKRLGDLAHRELRISMEQALQAQRQGRFDLHRDWIERLLTDYYDPMYRHQLKSRQQRIAFKGTHQEAHEWLDAKLAHQ